MDVETGDRAGEVCPSGEGEFTRAPELYGLELALLPPALVIALTAPLLRQLAPWRPRALVQLPSRIPSWWSAGPVRRTWSARRKIETGTFDALEPSPVR